MNSMRWARWLVRLGLVALGLLVLSPAGCGDDPHGAEERPAMSEDEGARRALLGGVFVFPPELAHQDHARAQVVLSLGRTGEFIYERRELDHDALDLPRALRREGDLLHGRWDVHNGQVVLDRVRSITREELRAALRAGEDADWSGRSVDEEIAFDLVGDGTQPRIQQLEMGRDVYARTPVVGGAPLHSLDELHRYLTAGTFSRRVSRQSHVTIEWTFAEDTFDVLVAGFGEGAPAGISHQEISHDWWPDGAVRLTGEWSITHEPGEPNEEIARIFSLNRDPSTLHLRGLRFQRPDGAGIDGPGKRDILIAWVDGKLRIELDGQTYMRRGASESQADPP